MLDVVDTLKHFQAQGQPCEQFSVMYNVQGHRHPLEILQVRKSGLVGFSHTGSQILTCPEI